LDAFNILPLDAFTEYLNQWRNALRAELRMNSRGHLKCRQTKLASSLPDAFPNLEVLRAYVQPVTSESEALLAGMQPPVPCVQWTHEHSLNALAAFCEEKFGWGTAQILPARFRSLLWHGSVIRMLRRAALDLDEGEGALWGTDCLGLAEVSSKGSATNTIPWPYVENPQQIMSADGNTVGCTQSAAVPECVAGVSPDPLAEEYALSRNLGANIDSNDKHPLLSTILASTTAHPRTDFLHEYRVELDPFHLVQLTQSGVCEVVDISDVSVEHGEVDLPWQKCGPKAADPLSLHRIWVPASMLQRTEQTLVDIFKAEQEAKQIRNSYSAVSKTKRSMVSGSRSRPQKKPAKGIGKTRAAPRMPQPSYPGASLAKPVRTVMTATNMDPSKPVPLTQQMVPYIIDLTDQDVIDLTTP